jgi:hypothetical protein
VAEHDTEREVEKRGPDLLTLIVGVATLIVSAYVLTDGNLWVPSVDPRWIIAGGALVVGLILLGSSLRGRKR